MPAGPLLRSWTYFDRDNNTAARPRLEAPERACGGGLRGCRYAFAAAAIGSYAVLTSAQPIAPGEPDGLWTSLGNYSIGVVTGEEPSAELAAAATLFQTCWREASGSEPEISERPREASNLWLGEGAVRAGLFLAEEAAELGPGEFIMRTYLPTSREKKRGAARQLGIVGAGDQALLDGLYAFFRRYAGHRWLAPGVVVPGRFAFTMPLFELRFAPPLAARELGFFEQLPEAATFRQAHGFPAAYQPGLLPPGDARALFAGGTVEMENPEAPEAAAAAFLALITTAPSAWDEKQQALAQRLGAPADGSSFSLGRAEHGRGGDWLALATALLEAAEAEPDAREVVIHVGVAADDASLPETPLPPSLIPHVDLSALDPRTVLRGTAAPALARLVAWTRQADAVYATLRAPSPALGLMPLAETMQRNLQYLSELGVRGVFIDAGTPAARGELGFNPWHRYAYAALLYEPDIALAEERERFFKGYYGYEAMQELLPLYAALEDALGQATPEALATPEAVWISDTVLADAQARTAALAPFAVGMPEREARYAALGLPFAYLGALRSGDGEAAATLRARMAEIDPGAAEQVTH